MKIEMKKVITVLKYLGQLTLEILLLIGAADGNRKKGRRR